MSSLPVELYRPIVEYVQDRRALFSLLLVSWSFSYEVERVLYRSLELRLINIADSHSLLLQRLANCERVASYVYSLRVIYGHPIKYPLLRNALQVLPNLKVLHIDRILRYTGINPLDDLPDSPPFHLHTFSTTLELNQHFKHFLSTQPGIILFKWQLRGMLSVPTTFPTGAFPALTSLSSSPCILQELLPTETIRHLEYHYRTSLLVNALVGHVVETIVSLSCREVSNVQLLAEIFPNLRYLQGSFRDFEDFILDISRLIHLEKLRLTSAEVQWTPNSREICLNLATRLFTCHQGLGHVEIALHTGIWWSITKGYASPPTVTEENHVDEDEWMKW